MDGDDLGNERTLLAGKWKTDPKDGSDMDLEDNGYILLNSSAGEEDEDGEGDIDHDVVAPPAAALAAPELLEDVADGWTMLSRLQCKSSCPLSMVAPTL